jgi:hypothetical protein
MKVLMPEGQGDLDDEWTMEAAQSGAGCAKAAGRGGAAERWEGAGGCIAGAGGEREHVCSVAELVRRDEV